MKYYLIKLFLFLIIVNEIFPDDSSSLILNDPQGILTNIDSFDAQAVTEDDHSSTTTHPTFQPITFSQNYTYKKFDIRCKVGQTCIYSLSIPINKKSDFNSQVTALNRDEILLPTIEGELSNVEDELNVTKVKVEEILSEIEQLKNVTLTKLDEINQTISNMWSQLNNLIEKRDELDVLIGEIIYANECYGQFNDTCELPTRLPGTEPTENPVTAGEVTGTEPSGDVATAPTVQPVTNGPSTSVGPIVNEPTSSVGPIVNEPTSSVGPIVNEPTSPVGPETSGSTP